MKRAFTLIEILIVVAILGLVAAIGIPSFIGSRNAAEDSMKEVNVAAVNAAKEQWAIINNKSSGSSVTWSDIEDYVGGSVTNISDLDVGGDSITINSIGNTAYY